MAVASFWPGSLEVMGRMMGCVVPVETLKFQSFPEGSSTQLYGRVRLHFNMRVVHEADRRSTPLSDSPGQKGAAVMAYMVEKVSKCSLPSRIGTRFCLLKGAASGNLEYFSLNCHT